MKNEKNFYKKTLRNWKKKKKKKEFLPGEIAVYQETKCQTWGVPIMTQKLTNLTSIHEDADSIPGLVQWVKDPALL